MKTIDITKLERLSKNQNELSSNQKVVFESPDTESFHLYENTDDMKTNTMVQKKDSKITGIAKEIKYPSKNIREIYKYFPEGQLQTYMRFRTFNEKQDFTLGQIIIREYIEVIGEYRYDGSIEFQRNYNELYNISIEDIIDIARKEKYKDITIDRVYHDDYVDRIPGYVSVLNSEFMSNENPYWIIGFKESLGENKGHRFIFRIYDGVSGNFIKEESIGIANM